MTSKYKWSAVFLREIVTNTETGAIRTTEEEVRSGTVTEVESGQNAARGIVNSHLPKDMGNLIELMVKRVD